MALGQRMKSPNYALDAKPLDTLDVDERSPPIVKSCIASLLAFFLMDDSLQFISTYVKKLHAILEKLNKLYVANLK